MGSGEITGILKQMKDTMAADLAEATAKEKESIKAFESMSKAKAKGLVLMEAFHWFYHPFRERLQQLISSGVIGDLVELEAGFMVKAGEGFRSRNQIRYQAELAGGTMMDMGCYALNCVHVLLNRQVPQVLSASAQKWPEDEEIDDGMTGHYLFPRGIKATTRCSFVADPVSGTGAIIKGSRGIIEAKNFALPHVGNRITVTVGGKQVLQESVDSGGFSTYDLQLLAFCSHVRQVRSGWVTDVNAFANTGQHPVVMMELIDQVYAKAGMQPRSGPAGIKVTPEEAMATTSSKL